MHKAEPRLAIPYEQDLYGKPRAPHPNPVGPLRRAETTIHSLSDLKNLFQLPCTSAAYVVTDGGRWSAQTGHGQDAAGNDSSVTTTIFI